MNDTRTAVGYARMSSDQQQASIPQQREWLERAARAEGVTLARVFEDHGIAGDDLTRPGLQAMLSYTEKHRPGVLLVWNLDRVSRAGSFETGAIFGRLEAAGCRRVVTQERVYDLAEAVDRLLINVGQDLTRKAYAESMARNTARGRLKKVAKAGRWQGHAPYGYRKDADGRLVVHDDEAAVIRRVFDLYLGGESLLGVVRALGNGWTRCRIHQIISCLAYAGHLAWGQRGVGKYVRTGDGDVQMKNKPYKNLGIVVPNTHPPIVAQDVFDRANARLRERYRRFTTPTGEVWLFAGIIRCQCGHTMTGMTRRNGGYVYKQYRCGGSQSLSKCGHGLIKNDALVRTVAEELRRSISSPELLADVRRSMEQQTAKINTGRREEQARLERELAELDGRISRAADRLIEVDRSLLPDAQEALTRLRKRREEAAARLQVVRAVGEEAQAGLEQVEQSMAALERLGETLADPKDPAAAKELLQTCVEKVVVCFDTKVSPTGKTNRHTVTHVEVHLSDRLLHLLDHTRTGQQVYRVLLAPVQKFRPGA